MTAVGAMTHQAIDPPVWSVPREWPTGTRCFVLCGWDSVRAQMAVIPTLQGRFVTVKEGVLLRPDSDCLMLGGERTDTLAKPLIPRFTGKYMVVRQKFPVSLPPEVKRVTRTKIHTALCDLPTHVAGYDNGTSAINMAYHFGATEIVLIGYDMTGGRWFHGMAGFFPKHPERTWQHPLPVIPEDHFRAHMQPLPAFAKDAERKGIKIWNTSPISRVTCFEYRDLETFL